LADYADTGGIVVAFNFDWFGPPFGLEGRWQTGGYSPFVEGGPTNFSNSCLGTYDMSHPLMQNISAGSLCAFYRHSLALSAGAVSVAEYQDATHLVAYKTNNGHTGVGINAYVGDFADTWSGPFGRVVVNAGRWLIAPPCGTPSPTPTATRTPTATPTVAGSATPTPTCVGGGTPGPWSTASPYPITDVRYAFAQTATHLYVFGGVSNGTRVNNVNRLVLATGMWEARAAMPFTSEAPTCALMASTGIVYCAEGDTGSGFASYNIATDTWTPLASIPGGDHYGSASGAFNGKVFVAGGTTAFSSAVQVYTVSSNT